MTIHNNEVADKFTRLANLLEIEGANPFRVRAYRNAARMIAGLNKNIADLIAQGENLTELPGIGKDLADKIHTLVETGELPLLDEVESRTPPILNDLMKIEGLGPKRVQVLYKKLKIKNINDLKNAIARGRVKKLAGFGEKTEQKILQGIEHLNQYSQRTKLADVFPVVDSLLHYLKSFSAVKQVECAGSFRRRKETVGDLDFLVSGKAGNKIINHFLQFNEVEKINAKGTTRASVRLHSGIQVDLRVISSQSYGAALLYFTGSKEHNIAIRKIALQKKYKINEYGIYKGSKQVGGRTEKEVYNKTGLAYIEPELREDRGEIEAARQNHLPTLVSLKDIRGDLHCLTNATDGNASLESMAKAAEQCGYEYIAITDHSKHLKVAHGLNKKQLFAQIKAIDKLNAKLKNVVILKSIEVDILEDGTLDLPDDVLKELDLVVCAIHSNFNLPLNNQTDRILRAMDNPHFNILAHPTGRLINRREPYAINMERVLHAAKDRGCILEVNSQPDRLDLNDIHCKMAKEIGVKFSISSAARSTDQLAVMRYGIYQARRGWLTKSDVINTRSLRELRKLLKK